MIITNRNRNHIRRSSSTPSWSESEQWTARGGTPQHASKPQTDLNTPQLKGLGTRD
jgi:hypothetical protein